LDFAYGYPWPALHWWCRGSGNINPQGAIGFGPTPYVFDVAAGRTLEKNSVTYFPRHLLPYAPVWGGLVADVLLVYATLVWLMWAVGLTRAWWRRHRGRCEACGYDMAGIGRGVCPECGHERDPRDSPAEPGSSRA
jgi:hypothetical protein